MTYTFTHRRRHCTQRHKHIEGCIDRCAQRHTRTYHTQTHAHMYTHEHTHRAFSFPHKHTAATREMTSTYFPGKNRLLQCCLTQHQGCLVLHPPHLPGCYRYLLSRSWKPRSEPLLPDSLLAGRRASSCLLTAAPQGSQHLDFCP